MDQSVMTTCLEMLDQRGYEIIKNDETGIIGKKDAKHFIVVFFSETTKLDVERVKEYLTIMRELEINHSIIVFNESVTPVARKVVEELPKNLEFPGYTIELFEARTLRYNITKHRLVPSHKVLSRSESLNFREKYGIKFPVLLKIDPIVRFYNFQRGDVVKITRHDGFVSYRIVK